MSNEQNHRFLVRLVAVNPVQAVSFYATAGDIRAALAYAGAEFTRIFERPISEQDKIEVAEVEPHPVMREQMRTMDRVATALEETGDKEGKMNWFGRLLTWMASSKT